MAHILIWDSITKRRRSISDTFYDNGLATIKGYLEEKGHRIEVVDWAQDGFFQDLSPLFLARLLRRIYKRLLNLKSGLLKKAVGLISIGLQELLSLIQQGRLKKYIKELVLEIKRRDIHVVGVKLWYGEAFKNAKYLVNLLKKTAPAAITIAGGYHVTLYEERILEFSNFDLGVVCEGEFALEKLLSITGKYENSWDREMVLNEIVGLAEQGQLENLIYRSKSPGGFGAIRKTQRREIKTHGSKSIPRYTLNKNKVRIHVMVESLGCDWARCNFCVHPYFYPHYSLRDADEIIREIKEMLKTGIGIFRFAGSDTPPVFGAKIAQKIIENNLNIIFGMGSRPINGAQKSYGNLVNAYETLIRGGLRTIFMGGETGNDLINQEVMNKGVRSEDIVYTIKALREAEKRTGERVYLSLALIFPPPLLGKLSLKEVEDDNIKLLKETMPDSVMITPPGPFLHTRWHEEQKRFGFSLKEGVIRQAMEYEYVLYKPPHLWPRLDISLDGKPFKQLLKECGQFRDRVERVLGIPTDISDEHFLMFYAAGIRKKEDIMKAKQETMLDIISCDYSLTSRISQKVNEYSERLADVSYPIRRG